MTDDERARANADRVVGEVRALREQLHDLVNRLQSERPMWEKALADLQGRPRLTASQRTRLRGHISAHARRRVR